IAALGVLVVGLVLGGITSQASHIDDSMSHAVDKVKGWAQDLGITSAADVAKDIKKAVPDIGHTLLKGVAGGISGLTSLLVFLGFSAFITFSCSRTGRRWAAGSSATWACRRRRLASSPGTSSMRCASTSSA
ncbi:MAG: hypothetical protein ACXVRH_12550, partial [Thermoleophilaceae bacterium]